MFYKKALRFFYEFVLNLRYVKINNKKKGHKLGVARDRWLEKLAAIIMVHYICVCTKGFLLDFSKFIRGNIHSNFVKGAAT